MGRPHLSPDVAARRRLAALAAVALIALVVGLVAGSGPDGGGSSRSAGRGAASARKQGAAAKLPLRRQLGQLLVSSFDGPAPPSYIRRRLAAGETAGVILFGRNAASPAALRSLTRALQSAAGGGALVAVDQEGGQIRSVPFAGPQAGQAAQGPPRSSAGPRRPGASCAILA